MPPSPDEIRAELERILAAEQFVNGERHPRFLRYVVDRTLAGEGEQLKEYVLGVEVFDRPADYDPRLDSIVRVEARRLRAKLDDYYSGIGAGDPVIINIPKGSYAPTFHPREAPPPPEPDQEIENVDDVDDAWVPPPQTSSSFTRWVVVAAVAGAIAAIGLFGWRGAPATATSGAAAPAPPTEIRIAVLPFVFFSSDPSIAMLAARLTDGITTELARLGTLSVVSRTSAAQFVSEQRPVSEVASILGADYVMEGSAVVEQGQLKVSARLVDGARDRKVWVGEYQSRPEQLDELEVRIASEAGPAALKLPPTQR